MRETYFFTFNIVSNNMYISTTLYILCEKSENQRIARVMRSLSCWMQTQSSTISTFFFHLPSLSLPIQNPFVSILYIYISNLNERQLKETDLSGFERRDSRFRGRSRYRSESAGRVSRTARPALIGERARGRRTVGPTLSRPYRTQ